MMKKDTDEVTRVLLVGAPESGRSGLIHSYIHNEFPIEADKTSFGGGYVQYRDATHNLTIQDSMPLTRNGLSNISIDLKAKPHVVLICVDLSKPHGLDDRTNPIQGWKNDIEHYGQNDTKIVIIGTKSDIANPTSSAALKEIAAGLNLPYVECSAITGKNVQAVFDKAKNPVLDVVHHNNPPGWAQKKEQLVTINGLEPFFKALEKKGTAISSFNAIFADSNIASSSHMTINNKQGIEQLKANMVKSKTQISVVIHPAKSNAGREVEIFAQQDKGGELMKEIAAIVKGTMDKCKALSGSLSTVVGRNEAAGEVIRSDAMAGIKISTSQNDTGKAMALNRAMEMAGVEKKYLTSDATQKSASVKEESAPAPRIGK